MAWHLSPLHAEQVALGARFAPFGGWSMPLDYAGGGVLAEHGAVRAGVGLFDVSHLGELRVMGPGAAEYLNARLTNDLGRIEPGRAQYTMLANQAGGVVDDMIAYLFTPDDVRLVPNAANSDEVAARLGDGLPSALRISDHHTSHVVLAVQGPKSKALLEAMGLPADMGYMAFREAGFADGTLSVCRTGYTGEHGYELIASDSLAAPLWAAIMTAGEPYGIKACGLGSRDTLRTEMGYALHGQDISQDIDPVEAGLGWAVGWAKPAFDGDEALKQRRTVGPDRRLRGLKAAGRGIPRPGMSVRTTHGKAIIGEVTSGTFSPTLRTGIALALVDANLPLGAVVGVDIRGRAEPFEVVKPPFVASRVSNDES